MRDRGRPLWSLSACELAEAYAAGLSPCDVVEATISRIREVNPQLNAIITLDEVGARRAAEESGRRWRQRRPSSALDGVPVTIKDNILVAGLRATWGSQLYSSFVPAEDELPVLCLRNSGAVVLGKTNVPEFTVHGYTDNRLFGTTRNPWNVDLTPGGSSGGAVAAVASGMGAFALATDGGGSIRRPAAHTGLVGFKPSRDTVPRGKGFPAILHNFEVVGPIARRVADVIQIMDTIAGGNWARSKSLGGAKRPRIAFAPTFSGAPVDPFIREVVGKTVDRAKSLGLDVKIVPRFDLADRVSQVWPIISQTGIAWLMDQHIDWERQVSPAIVEMATLGQKLSAQKYLGALDQIAELSREFERFFKDFDFLVTPTTAAMPWNARELYPPVIDGQTVDPRGHAVFTPLANAIGLPAISLPCLIEDGNLPVGLQIVGAQNQDWPLLAFASAFESHLFFHRWPP